MLEKLKNLNSIITLSLITSVLYYCGYLSLEYHNKILGISINYDPVEYLKSGGDFLIYSFIDFLSYSTDVLQEPIWLDLLFYIGLILTLVLYKKNKLFRFMIIYQISVIVLSVYYLRHFFNHNFNVESINYLCFKNYYLMFKYYWLFFAVNLMCIFSIIFINSKDKKSINLILLAISISLLPCLYGVYGKSYEYPFIEKRLIIGTDGEYLVSVSLEINPNSKTAYFKQINKDKKDKISFKYSKKYNFFDYIKPTLKK